MTPGSQFCGSEIRYWLFTSRIVLPGSYAAGYALPLLRLPENTRGQRRWLHPKSPDANMHISIAPHIQLKDKKHEGKMSHGVAVLLQLLSIYLQLFCVFQAVFFYFPSHEMTQTCNFSHLGSNHVPFSSDSHIYYFISS